MLMLGGMFGIEYLMVMASWADADHTDSLWIESAMAIIGVALFLSIPWMFFLGIIMNDSQVARSGFAWSRIWIDSIALLLAIGFFIWWGINGSWPFAAVPSWEAFAEYINLFVGISEDIVIYITVSGIVGVFLDVFLFYFAANHPADT